MASVETKALEKNETSERSVTITPDQEFLLTPSYAVIGVSENMDVMIKETKGRIIATIGNDFPQGSGLNEDSAVHNLMSNLWAQKTWDHDVLEKLSADDRVVLKRLAK